MQDLDTLRRTLRTRRLELRERRRRINADLHRSGGALSQDFAEQAGETQNDEALQRINEAADTELGFVDRALLRLQNGTYGSCTHCGRPIEKARLEAILYAETCVQCADTGPHRNTD